jgi:16S rRNA (cytosine967-C5)-methyltransferase
MVRQLAWEILRSGNTAPLREVDIAAGEVGLAARDRGLLRRIIGSEVRHRGTLRAIVNQFARGKPKAGIRAHLHVALAQFFWCDRVPPRAAVSEVVDATRRTLGASKTTYVNAVLRNVLRARLPGHLDDPRRDIVGSPWHFPEPIFHDPAEHPLLWAEDALSVPSHLMKRWVHRMGKERAFELGRFFLEEPNLSLRATAGEGEAMRAELLEAFVPESDEETPPALAAAGHPAILIAPRSYTEVFDCPAFREGRVTVQGETALRAAELCGAKEGEAWLDLCAAPGGKTAVLAATGAKVTAVDVSEAKLRRLGETLERLGLADAVELLESDGTAALAEREFDGVLVDAPCSNTGVLGARPGARWRFGPSTQKELTKLQARLFNEAAERVRPGGALVWSTCSLETDENAQQIKHFLEAHPDWSLDESHEFLPGEDGPTDGGFSARLRRS